MDSIELAIDLGQQIGNHPARVVIRDEGTVAVRSGDRIFVSRPGVDLAKLVSRDFLSITPAPLLAAIETENTRELNENEVLLAGSGGTGIGPEALYIADLLQRGPRMLVHIQPVTVNQILASPRARQFADRPVTFTGIHSFGGSMVLVPYADPGVTLAKEIRNKVNLWKDRHRNDCNVILLQNNGMIVLGDSAEQIIEITEKVLKAADIFIGAALLGGPQFLTVVNITKAMEYRKSVVPMVVVEALKEELFDVSSHSDGS
jgi:hypothetical protein